MAARKSKDARSELQASLIPVIERHQEQLRKELDQARRQAESRIRRARQHADQHIQQGRQGVSELTGQTRKERLCETQTRAEQIIRSSEQDRAHLRQRIEKNMPVAVARVVDAVTAGGVQT